jgi:hypothetical protein
MSHGIPRRSTCIAATLATALALAGPCLAQESEGASKDLSAEVASRYVWRGQLLNPGPVLQPSFVLTTHGFAFGAWASIDLTHRRHDGQGGTYPDRHVGCEEVDLSVGWSRAVGRATWGATLVNYSFPGIDLDQTTELQGTVAIDLPVSITVLAARDLRVVDGLYASLALAHEFELRENVKLALGASLGWADRSYDGAVFSVEHASISDVGASVSLSRDFPDVLTLTGSLRWSDFPAGDVGDAVADSGQLVVALGVAHSF